MLKKVAAINDLSGVGRCSLTAALPILSALKVQCCPFPTAILSSQTGYPEYSFFDFTNEMNKYSQVWKNLNLEFDCIYSGFLGSENQVAIVQKFIDNNPNSLVVVDPIMGDNGVIFPFFTPIMCESIKKLVVSSDLTTPNLTEACYLTNRKLDNLDFSNDELINIAKDICDLGPSKVVITGILRDNNILNLSYDSETNTPHFTCVEYNNRSYSGTGDIFTSILCGLLTNGKSLNEAVDTATNFIYKVVSYTSQFNTDRNDGVMFEYFLSELTSI